MSTENTCPECHAKLPTDAPAGLCPRCLIRSAAGFAEPLPEVDFPDIGDAADVARRLPQFEIIELLGQGGMGVVYKARQPALDRVVALKILPPAAARSPDFVERFRREARALAKLSHPNIVGVHECGESGGLYYFVMEYVDGTNLRALLHERKLTPAEALAIVPRVCDALEYAHGEGVIHRDIKPENLLLDKKGRVKIADFGLAKLLRRESLDVTLTLSGAQLGTLRYMAPEQMERPETVDHRADIYSLGVVIYEMLTGEVPMGRFAPPSERAQVDVRLDEIVLRSLERDVERRYQHASEVKTAVEGVAQTPAPARRAQPEAAALPSLLHRQISARSTEMMIAGILLTLTGLAGFGYGFLSAYNIAHSGAMDSYDATWRTMLLAYEFLVACLLGVPAFLSSLMMRKLRGHNFALVMSVLLMAVLPAFILIKHMAPPQVIFFQLAFSLYAGFRVFALLRKLEVEALFAATPRPAKAAPAEKARATAERVPGDEKHLRTRMAIRLVTLLAALAGAALVAAKWQYVSVAAWYYRAPGYASGLGIGVGILLLIAFAVTLKSFNSQRSAAPAIALAASLCSAGLMAIYYNDPPLEEGRDSKELVESIRVRNPEIPIENRLNWDVIREFDRKGVVQFHQRVQDEFIACLGFALLAAVAAMLDCVFFYRREAGGAVSAEAGISGV